MTPLDAPAGRATAKNTLIWTAVYAVAMGVLEAAVVIYLRRLYFPGGFQFPMQLVDTDIALVELCRELATLMMLVSVGVLAGRNRGERFAYFLFAFGVWDLAYYGFLKLAIGWPPSWFTWDILFLLPVPWVGPVLAPCIVAITMIGVAGTAIRFSDIGVPVTSLGRERALVLVGAAMIIVSFSLDWLQVDGPTLWQNIVTGRNLLDGLGHYVPKRYPWWIFGAGEGLALVGLLSYHRRLTGLARAVR